MSRNLTIKNTAKKGKGVFSTRNFREKSILLRAKLDRSNRIVSKVIAEAQIAEK